MNSEQHHDQPQPRHQAQEHDREIETGFGSLFHPQALVVTRNAVVLGEALRSLLIENECTGSNNFALGRAWHSSDGPSLTLIELRKEYANHGIDLVALLLNLARDANLPMEASAALKLLVNLDQKERIISEFVLPALLPELPGKKSRGNFNFACTLGHQFSDLEIDHLVQKIDIDRLSKLPQLLPGLAIGLNHIGGLSVIHSLASRVRSLDGVPGDEVSANATTTVVRIISILLEVESQRNPNGIHVSPPIAADLRDLYVALDDATYSSSLAKFLTFSDPVAAEAFFARLLDENQVGYASGSSRTKLALHFAQAACRCDDGPARVGMRLLEEEDPVAIGYLSAPLTQEENPEGHIALAELIIKEIEQERTPVILGTVATLAPIFDVSDVFEHVLSVEYQPGKLRKAFNGLSECQVPQPIWANSSLTFAENPATDRDLPFKAIDTIGSAAIASWCAEGGGNLAINALELLECARSMDAAWWLSSFAQVLALKDHKGLRSIIRKHSGMGSEPEIEQKGYIEREPNLEFGAELE